MIRCVIGIGVLLILASASPCQIAAPSGPQLTINLSPEVRSESVTIIYYLYGPFGAAGQSVRPQKDVHSYELPISYKGTAAEEVRLIAYVPSCQFQVFNVSLTGRSPSPETIQCSTLPTVRVAGEVVPLRLIQGKSWEIVIYYEAYWGCTFFKLSDCSIPQFPLATVPINADGSFEVTLPDFSADAQTSEHDNTTELRMSLRDSKNFNAVDYELIAPSEFKRGPGALAIRSYYPNPLQLHLVAQHQ